MSLRAPLDRLEMPLCGRALIEASAGTGKSYTLSALYLRLVLGHGEIARHPGAALGFTPQQILVLTFTRAATAELRQNIRERLARAARALAEPDFDPQDDFITQLMAEPAVQNDRAAMAQRAAAAARCMDQAGIYTIHSFCQRVLQRFAFAAGRRFDLVLEPDPQALLDQAINDYWRRHLLPLDAAVLQALADGDAKITSPQALWRAAKDADPPAGASPDPVPAAIRAQGDALRAVDAARQAAMDALNAQWDVLQAWRQDNAAHLNTRSYGVGFKKAIAAFRADGSHGSKTSAELQKLTPAGIKWKRGQEQDPPGELSCLQAIANYLALYEQDGPLDPTPLLSAARAWINAEVERQLVARAHISFDTMVTHLRQALDHDDGGELARQLRREWPCTLIDEFQDTDDDQYAIFRAIYADASPDECAWLMIGDPKQAIYGFRGADINTYLEAARSDAPGDPLRQYTLDTNYRAARGMVAATNTLFASSPLQGAALFGDAAIPFEPVQAYDQRMTLEVAGQAEPPLALHDLSALGTCSSGAAREQLAAHFAQHAAALLARAQRGEVQLVDGHGSARPLQPEDITFLVRSRTQADAAAQALRAAGVESVFLSDRSSVYTEPQALQLLAVLRAVAEPQDGRLLRAALAQPALAYDDATLAALIEDETRWQATLLQFRALHTVWARRGVLAMVYRLLFALDVPARIAHSDKVDGAERALTNLLQLAELLQQAATELDGMAALIQLLERRIQDSEAGRGGADDDATRIRLESERKRVRIVTLHGAKGLQYPLVILPFACLPDDPRKADEAARNEEMRLLYVGITRAQYACWLGLLPTGYRTSKTHHLEHAALGRLLLGNEHVGADAIAARVQELATHDSIQIKHGSAPTPEPVAADKLQPLRPNTALPTRRPPYWGITSYSGLVRGYHARLFSPDSERNDEPTDSTSHAADASGIHAVAGGRDFGTLVHGLLQACFAPGFDRSDPAALQALVAQRVMREPWAAQQVLIADWLGRVLRAPLLPTTDAGDETMGSTAPTLASLTRASAETEFWLAAENASGSPLDLQALDAACAALLPGPREPLAWRQVNGMLKGFIDLLFEHQGRYYVLDYKTNTLGASDADYDAPALQSALLAQRYELQGLIYLQALHRLLRLRLGPAYDPARQLGGCLFYFLRGVDHARTHGLIHLQATPEQLQRVEQLLGERRYPDRSCRAAEST